MQNLKNLKKYNELWESGKVTKPLVIIIGGAAGTGKTVLSYKLQKDIPFINYLTAALIRSLLGLFITEWENPYLRLHTFELQKVENGNNELDTKKLIKKFQKQSEPIIAGIENFLIFLASEKQHYIIEGANVLPRKWNYKQDKLIVIPLVMKVSDPKVHSQMMGGPTHNRDVTDEKMVNVRILNDFAIEEAKKNEIKVFEYNADYEEILSFIDGEIGKELLKMKL